RIQTIVKSYKKKYANRVLLLDAGDLFHGTTFANLSKGANVAKIVDSMEYDAVAVGNHDINFGVERLRELDTMMENTTILSANLKMKDGSTPFTPYIIKEIGYKGKIKVGIFGISTPETMFKASPEYVKDLVFEDPVETAKKMVDELRGKVNYIICLSHLGVNHSYEWTSIDIAKNVRGIDLIVDGHSHTILEEGLFIMGTPIVQAGYSDKYLGVVKVHLGKNGAEEDCSLISMSDAASYNENSYILETAEALEEANKQVTTQVIGYTPEDLDGERIHVRTGKTNLGTLIADSMRIESGADLSLINGGGIRDSIKAGNITKGQILQVLPFGNTLRVTEVSGKIIKETLEHGVMNLPQPAGRYPHVSGVTFDVDIEQAVGQRISNIKIDGQAIDMEKIYKLATIDFLILGGDEYSMLNKGKVIKELGTIDEVFASYLKNKNSNNFSEHKNLNAEVQEIAQ
ncbi:MAG: 5'-nucleotidase C-terminal domain-containing protein, partial [Spirochaetales bacterium]|nr:5'-nucleotidase C-terminal domain-containing protein [Spirochaetales bacterium]